MAKKKIDWRIVVAGLIVLGAVEITAILNGLDGKLLTAVIAIIALAIGVAIPSDKFIKR